MDANIIIWSNDQLSVISNPMIVLQAERDARLTEELDLKLMYASKLFSEVQSVDFQEYEPQI